MIMGVDLGMLRHCTIMTFLQTILDIGDVWRRRGREHARTGPAFSATASTVVDIWEIWDGNVDGY